MQLDSAKELDVYVRKLTDADAENGETDSSLDFAKDCGYIGTEEHTRLTGLCTEVGKMLGGMLRNPEGFLISDL